MSAAPPLSQPATIAAETPPAQRGVMYVGPSLGRSLLGLAVVLVTGRRP